MIFSIEIYNLFRRKIRSCRFHETNPWIIIIGGETDPYWYERAVFGYIYAKQQKYTEALAELLKSAADKCTVSLASYLIALLYDFMTRNIYFR